MMEAHALCYITPQSDGTFGASELESIKARLFGVLVQVAMRHLEHYHSDLYHDVHVIDTHVHGPCTLHLWVDSYGTFLFTQELQDELTSTYRPREHHYTLTLAHDDGQWSVEVNDLT